MKKYLITLFFLSFWSYSFAQDWAPVRVGETYHYQWYPSYNPSVPWNMQYPRVGESFFPSNLAVSMPIYADDFSIRVDSLITNGLDSQYQYQERFGICEACSVLAISEVFEGDSIGLFPKIIQKASGDYTLIYNKDTLELTNNLQVISTTNQAYSAYSVASFGNIYSIFNNINTAPVYDSIIYIFVDSNNASYSSIYEIGISRNNGLVYFGSKDFTWQIIGKEGNGNESGFETLEFEDIYGFNVGDQFYYHKYIFESSGSLSWPYPTNVLEFWYRWKILNRQNLGTDTIDYTIERVYYGQGYPVFSNLGIADTFNKRYIHSEDSLYMMEDQEVQNWPRYGYDVGCKNLFSASGNHMKYIGYDFNLTAQQNGPMWNWTDDYISAFYGNSANEYEGFLSSIDDFSTLYHKGLGRVYDRQTRMDRYDIRELIGYIKGTDTVGSTPNITIYTDIKDLLKTECDIRLLRNPTNDYLKVHYQNEQTKDKLNFSILDVMGRVLASYQEADISNKTYIFPVQDLGTGVYFLEVRQDGELLQTKAFVKA
ncbi:MAG: hypothetical protein ACI976_000459 [Aureispira sp.]|jgi:hypothetical protein